ncbi:hypothetical protein [Streptomyces xanthophaeus]|uniref:hypothetical protein n=1 Tax=Streptomyces xanthophaeus TaxID=67385 RepID=UPI00099BFF21|nr:hypothetical protein [Streptomyces xanthophaeus]
MTTREVHPTCKPRPPELRASAPGPPAPRPSEPRPGRVRLVLGALAAAATVPYLLLKAAWVAGSHLGIPADSVLREPGPVLLVANAVTLAMDACVILLVLVFTRPWGMRVPAWLLTVPVFVATGLLTPILFGFSGQLLARALGFGADTDADVHGAGGQQPFLDPWVPDLVYAGFTVQGLALAGLFVPYARERWGRLWQGVPGERLPPSTGVMAAAAALVGAAVGGAHLYWAFGGTAGLAEERVASWSVEASVGSAVHGVCAVVAGAVAVLLARGGRRGARWPLAVAWTSSAATACWGLWMLTAYAGQDFGPAEETTLIMYLPYAGQMITGLLSVAVLTRFLISRRPA